MTLPLPVPLRITSYNILAEAYATRRLYPSTEPAVLAWSHRGPAIVERVVAIAADVVCLQEVETRAWPALRDAFERHGYAGVHAAKGRGRPDGCALLHRGAVLRFTGAEPLHYDDAADGGAPSGHLALIGSFESGAGRLVVAGTHLRWQAPTGEAEEHIGYRQARELLDRLAAMVQSAAAIVVCGDFNVAPGGDIARLFAGRGFVDTHAAAPQPTCNPNRHAERIDYILVAGRVHAIAEPIPPIDDRTPLPSASEPSDHLPVTARLEMAAPAEAPAPAS